jgi:hypothetical protein
VRLCFNDHSLTALYGNNCRCFEYREKCISSLHRVEKLGIFYVESVNVMTAQFYRTSFF